jgi:uncharacterized protein (TIGR02246 family)
MDDHEAIKQLKARYFRTMDTKDWEGMRDVFTDDVLVDTTEAGGGVVEGGDAFVASLRTVLNDVVTVHHGHMPEIEIRSETEARGIWAMQDILEWPNGRRMYGYGHYHETYERIANGWRIKTLKLTRLRVDVSEPGED